MFLLQRLDAGIFILWSAKNQNKPLKFICGIKQKQMKAIPFLYDNHHGDLRSLTSIIPLSHIFTDTTLQLPWAIPCVCILSRRFFYTLHIIPSHRGYCATAHKICARKSKCCLQDIHYSRQVMSNFYQEKSIKKKKVQEFGQVPENQCLLSLLHLTAITACHLKFCYFPVDLSSLLDKIIGNRGTFCL